MLSIAKLKAGNEEYYLRLCKYYADGRGEPPGVWGGGLASLFGMFGFVTAKDLKAFMRGFRPGDPPDQGGGLVQNAGKHGRLGAFDLTFSAPKDVSVCWVAAKPELRAIIEQCHDEAVKNTMQFFEDVHAWCRTGKGGTGK